MVTTGHGSCHSYKSGVLVFVVIGGRGGGLCVYLTAALEMTGMLKQ